MSNFINIQIIDPKEYYNEVSEKYTLQESKIIKKILLKHVKYGECIVSYFSSNNKDTHHFLELFIKDKEQESIYTSCEKANIEYISFFNKQNKKGLSTLDIIELLFHNTLIKINDSKSKLLLSFEMKNDSKCLPFIYTLDKKTTCTCHRRTTFLSHKKQNMIEEISKLKYEIEILKGENQKLNKSLVNSCGNKKIDLVQLMNDMSNQANVTPSHLLKLLMNDITLYNNSTLSTTTTSLTNQNLVMEDSKEQPKIQITKQEDDFSMQGTYSTSAYSKEFYITGHGNGSIVLRNIKTNTVVQEFNKRHNGIVCYLVVVKDRFILSSSSDSIIKVWDYSKKEYLYSLNEHSNMIMSMIYILSSNTSMSNYQSQSQSQSLLDNILISSDLDGVIIIWKMFNSQLVVICKIDTKEYWLRQINYTKNKIIYINDYKTIGYYNVSLDENMKGKFIQTKTKIEYTPLCFTRNSNRFLFIGTLEGYIIIYDIENNEILYKLKGHNHSIKFIYGYGVGYVLIITDDGYVKLFQFINNRLEMRKEEKLGMSKSVYFCNLYDMEENRYVIGGGDECFYLLKILNWEFLIDKIHV